MSAKKSATKRRKGPQGTTGGHGANPSTPVAAPKAGAPRSAGAFDIRNFIGTLLGLYGIILIAMGLLGDQALEKTGGVNANLWAGVALAVVGAGFMGWARWRPISVPAERPAVKDDPTRPAPRRKRTH